MDKSQNLTSAETHFSFGRNWAEYAEKVRDVQIKQAVIDLDRLLGSPLNGKRFLDIGCGSGLHSLAALHLGANEVLAVDIDPDSVSTTQSLLGHFAPEGPWHVEVASVFELDKKGYEPFDVVYSWGVLHHTGDLFYALRCAAALVSEGGLFVFALYRKTWMCPFWKREKKWYAHASPKVQAMARKVYVSLLQIAFLLTGRSFKKHVQEYRRKRGMDFYHDVHDWLGGWPYESIQPNEIESFMAELGFTPIRSFVYNGGVLGRPRGIFGSGNDEYVYCKTDR